MKLLSTTEHKRALLKRKRKRSLFVINITQFYIIRSTTGILKKCFRFTVSKYEYNYIYYCPTINKLLYLKLKRYYQYILLNQVI